MSDTYFPSQPVPVRRWSTWTRFIVDYNPCFLLSAVCMLFGCRLLNDAVNARTGDVAGALWLILTINVYEFCLLGVAVLIRRLLGMRRDVGILLIVGVLFLCDIAFVVGDLSTARPGVGLIVMTLLTMLASAKAFIVLRLLGAPKQMRTLAIITGQVAMILLLPIVLKGVSARYGGNLPPLAICAGWWVAGLLPIVWTIVLNYRTLERLPGLARVYVIVPYLAMLGHLLACTWVFKLPFFTACYAPVMLGLAICVGLSRHHLGRNLAANIQWAMAAVAVMLAVGSPPELSFGGVVNHWAMMSSFRLALIGAAVVNLHGLIYLRHWLFGVTLGLMTCAGLLGPDPRVMLENARLLAAMIRAAIWRAVPTTAKEWGVVTVGASFILLAMGAAVSLYRKPRESQEVLA